MDQEEEGPYGYYLTGCHHEHGHHNTVFEFFDIRNVAELEKRIGKLVSKERHPYRAEDLHVIKGCELSFLVEKEVVREVSVKVALV